MLGVVDFSGFFLQIPYSANWQVECNWNMFWNNSSSLFFFAAHGVKQMISKLKRKLRNAAAAVCEGELLVMVA